MTSDTKGKTQFRAPCEVELPDREKVPSLLRSYCEAEGETARVRHAYGEILAEALREEISALQDVRAGLVVSLREIGMSERSIASSVGVSQTMVRRILGK